MPDTLYEDVAGLCNVTVEISDEGVSVGSLRLPPGSAERWFDPVLKDLMPRNPRGDYRERTVNHLVRDAIHGSTSIREAELFEREFKVKEEPRPGAFFDDEAILDPAMRPVFGKILADHYVIETSRGTKFLFPFQSDLPGNYKFAGNYKMFNGLILAFFAKPGPTSGFNTELLGRFYDLFNDTTSLSLLEQQALRIAQGYAATHKERPGHPGRAAEPSELISTFEDELGVDVFFPELHERLIQADLDKALRMVSLGRKDRVNAVLQVFYFHLALYFWRAAYVLEEQASLFLLWLGGDEAARESLDEAARADLESSPFQGQIKFRVATPRPRSVSRSDPAAAAFAELNNRRLLLLPVNLSLLKMARSLLAADNQHGSFADIAGHLAQDPPVIRDFDCACRIAAADIALTLDDQQREDIVDVIRDTSEPGFQALRSAILKRWRRDLRRSTTDITAQLMRRGGKGISATRGNVQYFEIGQDLLLLLTKLIAGDELVRYGDFLHALSLYGLAPQDRREESLLADVLRSLQLLEKYSDTGEAMYVQHFL